MSESTETVVPLSVVPPVIQDAAGAVATMPVAVIAPRDWVRLAQGFYFLFCGLLVSFAALVEAVATATPRLFQTFISGVAAVATLAGAWRLHQAHVSDAWHRHTRALLIAAGALVYLWPFLQMWLRLSGSGYLLGHALVYAGVCVAAPALLSLTVGALARARGQHSLATQAVVYAGTVAVILVLPFGAIAFGLVYGVMHGVDPLQAVRSILATVPQAVPLVLLVPVSLALSLAWAAKDLAVGELSNLGGTTAAK